jgi:hypothetical protein
MTPWASEDNMTYDLEVARSHGADWSGTPATQIGRVPSRVPTPYYFVLVRKDGRPFRRFDIHLADEEVDVAVGSLWWNGWFVIAFGSRVVLVPDAEAEPREFGLGEADGDALGYFIDFRHSPHWLLVIFGTGLARIDPNGALRWKNNRLGLDGIQIEAISETVIKGRGEWDPPGGWRPFEVSLESGRLIG